ncbi:MAG: DNA polymerase ligase N-terminal domain-containing protein [Sedimentisphaerales bacterium]
MRRFVIQRHSREEEPVHWDLMLEQNGALETYRVGLPPVEWGNEPVEAAKIFDHSLKFLTYEGSVNKGKGQVKTADSGTYEVMGESNGMRRIRFSGMVVKNGFTLRQIEGERWELKNIEH